MLRMPFGALAEQRKSSRFQHTEDCSPHCKAGEVSSGPRAAVKLRAEEPEVV